MPRRFRILRPLLVSLALLPIACGAPLKPRPAPVRAEAPLTPMQQAVKAIEAGDGARAQSLLSRIDANSLNAQDALLHRSLRADASLIDANPIRALNLLPPPQVATDRELAAYIESVRARALFALDDPVAGVRTLVAREQLLRGAEEIRKNRDLIWTGLRTSPLDTNILGRLGDADPITRGWVELALIGRSVWLNPRERDNSVRDWADSHSSHPGQQWIDRLDERRVGAQADVRRVGLLLPVQGKFSAAASSIRDGFLAAWYADYGSRPDVRVYNTGESPESLLAAVQRAANEGADFLVGPLRKEQVSELAVSAELPMPVLALNYLDASERPPFNFFQWGLAPEDEAIQAAERAASEDLLRAVALVPDTTWGDRVLAAYGERLTALGGQVLDVQRFAPDTRDFSAQIRQTLNLDASRQRHASIRAMVGTDVEFEPRRRSDVDHVFIAARAAQGRQIKPQLKFHLAGDLPVFATALIYDGGSAPEPDLNGVRFCDMPWMIGKDRRWTDLRQRLSALFTEREQNLPRLFVLGHDAYLLMRLIQGGQLQPGMYLPAASGNLALQADGRITRALSCAEFRGGVPEIMEIALPETPADFEDAGLEPEREPEAW